METVAPSRSRWNDEARAGLLFALPPVIAFFLFAAVPVVFSLYAGFTDWSVFGSSSVVGLENFAEMFSDERFWRALGNTFFYMIGIPIGMGLSMLMAMGFNRKIPGVRAFRVIYYIPVVSSIVAVAILWRWLYNGDYGLLNQLLDAAFGIKGPNWMYNEHTVKPGIIALTVWRGIGSSALLYLAGMQNMPKQYYEAARIDGANNFQCFFKITVPLLAPITFFILITSVIGGAQMYIEPSIMTEFGGPNYSAATIVYYLWEKAFGSGYRMGYACAVAWVLALIIFVVTWIQFKVTPKSDNYLE